MSQTFQIGIGNAAALALNSALAVFQLATPAGIGLAIHAVEVSQINDETAQQLGARLTWRSTASTLVTAAQVGVIDKRNAPAHGLTLSTTTNAYGIASATGTRVDELALPSFDARVGLCWEPSPNRLIHMPPSSFLTFAFDVTPGATPLWLFAFSVEKE